MKAVRQELGIFGGTFDPPTNRHREIIVRGLEYVQRLCVVPCGRQEGKVPIAYPWQRVIMTALMVAELVEDEGYEGRLMVSTTEVEQGLRLSKSVETKQAIERMKGVCGAVMFIGADLVPTFPGWEGSGEMMGSVLVHPREGYEKVTLLPGMTMMGGEGRNGGSKSVRELIARGDDVTGLVPRSVYRYIVENGIYCGG